MLVMFVFVVPLVRDVQNLSDEVRGTVQVLQTAAEGNSLNLSQIMSTLSDSLNFSQIVVTLYDITKDSAYAAAGGL